MTTKPHEQSVLYEWLKGENTISMRDLKGQEMEVEEKGWLFI